MHSFRPLIIFFQKHPVHQLWQTLISVQFGSMVLLTSQQTGMPFLVRTANKSHFLPTTCVFMMEVLKLLFCFLVVWKNCASFPKAFSTLKASVWNNKVETLKVSIPAVVYAIQNNLYYIALANIDATTYSVTYQLRILTTAVLSVCLLQKRLSVEQWGALILSLFGVIFVQVDQTKSVAASVAGNKVLGILSTFGMCWTSAFAGVYFEKMLKDASADVWIQNIRLSLLTLIFAALTMVVSDFTKIIDDGFFQGWTSIVWLVTVLNSVGGICVSIVMKYADNVKKTYCQSIAIGLTALISIFLGERTSTAMLFEGVTMVIVSVFLYAMYPPHEYKKIPQTPEIDEDEELAPFSSMDVDLTAVEVIFAQKLACGEPTTRRRALKVLHEWIVDQSSKRPFDENDLKRLCKGLHYVMWMQDKMLMQEELADRIAGLLTVFKSEEERVLYVKAFLESLSVEWIHIDRWRMDKFLMEVRRMLRSYWDAFKQTAISDDNNFRESLKFHFASLLLDELDLAGGLNKNQVMWCLQPYADLLGQRSISDYFFDSICEEIFMTILHQRSEVFAAMEQGEDPAEQSGGIEFDYKGLSKMLFDVGKKPDVTSKRRAKIYALVKKFDTAASGSDPLLFVPPEPAEKLTNADFVEAEKRILKMDEEIRKEREKSKKARKEAKARAAGLSTPSEKKPKKTVSVKKTKLSKKKKSVKSPGIIKKKPMKKRAK
ncbi:unnamed protein product [Caenorhabditis auriculariae]|uniref:Uncharacterized protein n=1 Tax=Caenorhabditis auriculariae TaxID=2777116 RepID=A0A8S1HII8_9PELO|nr:unnamed protein product [Caenorhabditis auriculariae]